MQTFRRFDTPLTTITRDWIFGLNMRFVRRLEKLTLWPNLVVLPQTSHLPATLGILPLSCPRTGPELCFNHGARPDPISGAQSLGSGRHSRDLRLYHIFEIAGNGANFPLLRSGRSMTRVAIVTDSSSDLAPAMVTAGKITVVPLPVAPGADTIPDRPPALRKEAMHFEAAFAGGREERSAMVDVFAAAFTNLAREHDAVVAILLSTRLGGSVAAATNARARLSEIVPVEIVDSRSASMGLGFQVMRAAELAQGGASAGEIGAMLRATIDRYHVVFSVESVEHLRASGWIGRSAAMIAEALQLKPLLRIDEGQIVPYERARTRARAIVELADFVHGLPAVERCAVMHAASRSDANHLLTTIARDTGLAPDWLTINQIGPAVAAQVGPGAIGVAVVEADVE